MSEFVKIAVDAMGGDNSPQKIIDGIIHNHKKNSKNFEDAQLFEDLSEISGMEDFANNLDDLVSLMDSEEIEKDKILKKNEEVREVFEKEINWRKEASKSLLPELEKYNLIIKHNIGLRLQSRLTKDQAKFVAAYNSIHRDISLNF